MLTVLIIKPDYDAELIDLEDGTSETIHQLVGGPYDITRIRKSHMIIVHNKSSDLQHFNRQIDRKLYFGTILIARSDGKCGLSTLENSDILNLVTIIPQKHRNIEILSGTQKSDMDERVKWLKEMNGFVQYGKRKAK